MAKFKVKKNELQKARDRLERVSKRQKQLQLNFVRSKTRRGHFKTTIYVERGVKEQHSGRGLLHRVYHTRFRIKGDRPSFTRAINSFEMQTAGGKFVQRSARLTNFIVHDVGQTALDVGLAGETVGIKTAETAGREIRYHYQNKYMREAVDDYHKGIFFVGKIAVDGIKGTRSHFRQKRQYKIERAKFKLRKAELKDFQKNTFKPKIKKNKADFKKKKADFKARKQSYQKGTKSKISKAMFKKRKQEFRHAKREFRNAQKQLRTDKKFKKQDTKNQKKIARHSRSGLLVLKPVGYTAGRLKASAWQRAVNEDSDNDMLHAIDSVKRRVAEPTARHFSAQNKLSREQKKRDQIADKSGKSHNRLTQQEQKLKEKGKQQRHHKKKRPKPKKSGLDKLKDGIKEIFHFVKNVYVKEVGKFFAVIAVPLLIILLVFLFILSIFNGTASGGGFTLGTYAAQDYDLSEAEKYYTQLAYNMNEKIIKVGDASNWKKGLKELGADTSGMKDKPVEWYWGNSNIFSYDPNYDFDCYKLWSFLCAYYYDFDAANGDIKYWSFSGGTKTLLEELFADEYEFVYWYDNTSHWEYKSEFVSKGYYSIEGSGTSGSYGYINIAYPDALPFSGYNNGKTIYFSLGNGEVLNYSDNYSATGWYLKNQFVDDYDPNGNKYGAWYTNGETCGYGIYDNGVLVTPIPYVIPSENWCSFLQKYDWVDDCRLYYNVRQKKSFDEAVIDKLNTMTHADERVAYYNLLAGNDTATLYGNHQTIYSMLPNPSIRDYSIKREFGYEMTGWNNSSEGLYQGIKVYADNGTMLKMPFDGKITDVDTNDNKITIRKDDVVYWYDGTGGTKRDTEITIANAELINGYEKGDSLEKGKEFAKTTAGNVNFHVYIDTDGYGWDYIDPRLVFY